MGQTPNNPLPKLWRRYILTAEGFRERVRWQGKDNVYVALRAPNGTILATNTGHFSAGGMLAHSCETMPAATAAPEPDSAAELDAAQPGPPPRAEAEAEADGPVG